MGFEEDPGSDTKWTWVWWSVMTSVATFNLGAIYKAYSYQSWSTISDIRKYQKWCFYFAVPFVLECGYRSWLPSIYNARQTLWDVQANSIMIDRTLACIGELCWISQICMVARYINNGLPAPSEIVNRVCYVPVLLCAIAECFSYYCTATTCYKWCAWEVTFWTISFAIMCPVALFLLCKLTSLKYQEYQDTTAKSAIWYSFILFLATLVYVPYMIFDNIPMYWQRYHDDQANNTQYFSFWSGLRDALHTRNVTRNWNHWQDDWFWMVAYFSLAAWSSILMIWAPRIKNSCKRDTQETMLDDEAVSGYRAGWLKYQKDMKDGRAGVIV